ncbi:hypothetical protein BVRB_5g102780 [Beta vulgaris subsp. vulgaris]|nr:hypothetical protein BVRB_5g102780 [Beta vulgaris subsp. vulgaris]
MSSKYSKYTKQNKHGCFSSILQRFISTGNLPTHPSPPDKSDSFSRAVLNDGNDNVVVVNNSPGIVAKLMGLDSLPKYEKTTTLDSLFRSKSLNSLQFLPDFDPTRAAFHRGARISASFHEQGQHCSFLGTIEEDLEKENEVVFNGKSKKRYEECVTNNNTSRKNTRRLKNNDDLREKCRLQKRKSINDKKKVNGKVGVKIYSKKNVDHNQDMCVEVQSDDLQRSPVSVLDHYNKEVSPFSKGKGKQKIPSNSRRKSSSKIKLHDNLAQDIQLKTKENYENCCNKIGSKHKLVKTEVKAADDFVEMLSYICKLAEKEVKDSKWVKKYDLMKEHLVEELSIHLGQEMVDLLLDELLGEIIML